MLRVVFGRTYFGNIIQSAMQLTAHRVCIFVCATWHAYLNVEPIKPPTKNLKPFQNLLFTFSLSFSHTAEILNHAATMCSRSYSVQSLEPSARRTPESSHSKEIIKNYQPRKERITVKGRISNLHRNHKMRAFNVHSTHRNIEDLTHC